MKKNGQNYNSMKDIKIEQNDLDDSILEKTSYSIEENKGMKFK